MPDLAELIEKIYRQQLRDEERLRDLEAQAVDAGRAITTSKEEIGQLLAAMEIAVKRGMVDATELETVRNRLAQGCPPAEQEDQVPPPESSDRSGEAPTSEEEGQEEQTEEGAKEEKDRTGPALRVRKSLIDTVYDIIQDFGEEAFTTADIRRELAEQYPEMFASINPASIPGTVARLYNHYDCGLERVGGLYTDGFHYRRKVKTQEEGGDADDSKTANETA